MIHTKAILIIGGSGFLGTSLALKLRDDYKVFATYHRNPIEIPGVSCIPMEVGNRNWVKRVVYMAKPDVVIFAGGLHGIDWAEENSKEAERVHTGGPATVSNLSEIFQTKFIFLSTCHVFDGTKGNYHETDTVLPSTAYGKAKLGGENFIRGKSLNYVILRTSPIYGRGNGRRFSFLDSLRMALDRGKKIELQNNEYHSFAHVDGLTDAVTQIIESNVRNKLLHFAGLTRMTHYDFGVQFANRFKYDPALVLPKKEAGAKLDLSLNFTPAIELLKIKPLLLEEGFDLIQKNLVPSL